MSHDTLVGFAMGIWTICAIDGLTRFLLRIWSDHR